MEAVPGSVADSFRGLNSGELYCRVLSQLRSTGAAPSCAVLSRVDADMMAFLNLPLPAPSELSAKRAFLRTRRAQCRRKAQLQIDHIRATAAALGSSATTAVHVEALRCAAEGYVTEFASCRRSVDETLMAYMLRFYASVEAERRHILHAHAMEQAEFDAALAHAKRNLHLETFAHYLESESAGRVQFRRLDPSHPQGVRCRRAALDNAKPHAARMEVINVYKLENQVVLDRFQTLVASLPSPKVKGLFCTVPINAIERCVAFGMTGTDSTDVFKATWYSTDNGATSTAKYAQQVATAATAIEFPKRFSRYSSFESTGQTTPEGLPRQTTQKKTQFLALCRVVMQQVAMAPSAAAPSPFPSATIDTMYFNAEEEYLVRHGHYVVPEFLIQLQVDTSVTSATVMPSAFDSAPPHQSSAKSEVQGDLAPVAELAFHGPHDRLPRPRAFPFESCVATTTNHAEVAKGLRKTKPELFGAAMAPLPAPQPAVMTAEQLKTQWQVVRTSVFHATVAALHQFWDRMGQAWRLHRDTSGPNAAVASSNQVDNDQTDPATTESDHINKTKAKSSLKTKFKALVARSPYLPAPSMR